MSEPGDAGDLVPAVIPTPRDRRRNDPVRRLSRRFDAICLEAMDPLEIAAHLEAQGYNNYRVRQEFGLATPFELAEQLYAVTPRRQRLRPILSERRRQHWRRQLLVAATLAITALLASQLPSLPWALLVGLLVWAQAGQRVVELVRIEGDDDEQQRVVAALLAAGLATVAVAVPLEPLPLLLGLVWTNLVGNLWLARPGAEARTPFVILPLLVTAAALLPNVAPALALTFAAITTLIGFSGRLQWPPASTLRRLVHHRNALALGAATGLGQGLLLVHLIAPDWRAALPGLGLVLLALAAGEGLVGWMRQQLARGLWHPGRREDAHRRVLSTADRLIKVLLLGLVPTAALLLDRTWVAWLPLLSHFALLALALALATLLRSLAATTLPAVAFAAAAALVALGLPFAPVALGLVLALYLGLLWFLRRPERYGSQIL